MSVHRIRNPGTPAPPERAELDDTELNLRELFVLWPGLEAALATDGAGPSATPSGGGGGGNGSPSVMDLDTERVRALVTLGVHEIEAEAIRLLRITPAHKVLSALRSDLAQAEQARSSSRATLARMRRHRREAPAEIEVTDAERVAAKAAIEDIATLAERIEQLRDRIARVEYRRSTLGVIEMLPIWYVQLRDRRQPLADSIKTDAARWRRDARTALNLVRGGHRIGWLCPHHRDEAPTQLRRVSDEAQLSANILAGRPQAAGEAPLQWKRSEAVRCPHCGETWKGLQQLSVLMRMIEQTDAVQAAAATGQPVTVHRRVLLLNGPDLARELGRGRQTLRAWALAGFITRYGTDAMGRTLYDVDEVRGVSDRAQRRRSGTINSGSCDTVMPEAPTSE